MLRAAGAAGSGIFFNFTIVLETSIVVIGFRLRLRLQFPQTLLRVERYVVVTETGESSSAHPLVLNRSIGSNSPSWLSLPRRCLGFKAAIARIGARLIRLFARGIIFDRAASKVTIVRLMIPNHEDSFRDLICSLPKLSKKGVQVPAICRLFTTLRPTWHLMRFILARSELTRRCSLRLSSLRWLYATLKAAMLQMRCHRRDNESMKRGSA